MGRGADRRRAARRSTARSRCAAAGRTSSRPRSPSLHAEEPRDWPQIAALYGELARLTDSPVVELNRAVAVAEAEGPEAGLEIVDGWSSTTTTTCTPPAPSCCAGSGAPTRPAPPTSARSSSSTTRPSGGSCNEDGATSTTRRFHDDRSRPAGAHQRIEVPEGRDDGNSSQAGPPPASSWTRSRDTSGRRFTRRSHPARRSAS